MQIRNKLAVAAVALLLVGASGVTAIHSFAQTTQPPAQSQAATAPDTEQAVGADTDQVDEQVGDQSAADTATEGAELTEDQGVADTDQIDELVGDQNAADDGAEAPEAADGQDAAPMGTPGITADQAKAAAETHLNAGTATKVELDDENGKLIYSVEIGASDVKVDAMTGAVLSVDSGQD